MLEPHIHTHTHTFMQMKLRRVSQHAPSLKLARMATSTLMAGQDGNCPPRFKFMLLRLYSLLDYSGWEILLYRQLTHLRAGTAARLVTDRCQNRSTLACSSI